MMTSRLLSFLAAALMSPQSIEVERVDPDIQAVAPASNPGDRLLQDAVLTYMRNDNSSTASAALFMEAEAKGDPRGALWMARLRLNGWCGVERNMVLARASAAAALDDVMKLADAGDPEAQFVLGACYADGLGVQRSMQDAAKWYEKAAENNHLLAMNNYAVYLANGNGVEADIDKARQLFYRAWKGGSPTARDNLDMYRAPDSKSKERFKELSGNKFLQAIGLPREEAVRLLMANDIILSPDEYFDEFAWGELSITFEDDYVTLDFNDADRLIGIYVRKSYPDSGRIRDVIPLGVGWDDDEAALKSKLGPPGKDDYNAYYSATAYEYLCGNYTFTVLFPPVLNPLPSGWILRRIWWEDPQKMLK